MSSLFGQADIVFEVLLFLDHEEWKCCFPFVISRTFYQVMSSDAFAEAYYANYKSLSSLQLVELKERITKYSIYYTFTHNENDDKQMEKKPKLRKMNPLPTMKSSLVDLKEEPTTKAVFWKLLRDTIYGSIQGEAISKSFSSSHSSSFGWANHFNKDNLDIRKCFSKMLEKQFHVKEKERETVMVISSENVKKLLELEKMDIKVNECGLSNACYHNTSCSIFNINYTIYLDCGYPIHVNSKIINVSLRSGNYGEHALSTAINGTHLFEWNYNENYFPVAYLNIEYLKRISQDIYKEKAEIWKEINLPESVTCESVFENLFMKLIDPLMYLTISHSHYIQVDDEFFMENIVKKLPVLRYYYSEWK